MASKELNEITTHKIIPNAIGLSPADFTLALDKLVPIKNRVRTNNLRDKLEILMDKDSGKEV